MPEGYIGFVEELSGANTQGATLNRRSGSVSTVPRHRKINEYLARTICRDLEIPEIWRCAATQRGNAFARSS